MFDIDNYIFTRNVGYPLPPESAMSPESIRRLNNAYIEQLVSPPLSTRFISWIESVAAVDSISEEQSSEIYNMDEESLAKMMNDFPMVSYHRNPKSYAYTPENGINLHYIEKDGKVRAELLLHELSHFLVATPKQRAMVNYGLGATFPYETDRNVEMDTNIDSNIPEFIAAILTIIALHHYGFEIKQYLSNASMEQCFYPEHLFNDIANALKYLTNNKIIIWTDNGIWPSLAC